MIKRRFIQGLLILALLCGAVLLAHPSAAWAEMSGDGSKDDPYQIRTADDLKAFASLVNSDNRDACAVLMGDIVLNGDVLVDGDLNSDQTVVSSFTKWTPIGDNNKPYTGTFDGNGHEISGLYINSNAGYAGLFGCIGSGGTVKNLTLTGSYISGDTYVGGICGLNGNGGSITNCSNSGAVTGDEFAFVGGICGKNDWGSITGCNNSSTVDGDRYALVGGICGKNDWGSITGCNNSSTVNGQTYAFIGGICGENEHDGIIKNCSNSGAVTGTSDSPGSPTYVAGICGENDGGSITGCSNSGYVEDTGSGAIVVGGICGWNKSSITNCYWLSDTAGEGVGGGSDTIEVVESKTAEAYKSGEVAWLLNQGQTDGPWRQTLGEGGDLVPTLDEEHQIVYRTAFYVNPYDKTDNIFFYRNVNASIQVPTNLTSPDNDCFFDGWYGSNTFAESDKLTGTSITVISDKEYWAKWTANVKLKANGGTIAEDKNIISYIYGVGATLPTAQDITRTGYTFDGWYDNAAFSGAPVTGITTTDFGDKTYYAKWTANTYKVTLNTKGDTINSGNVTDYTYGTETTLPTDVTRAGYTFAGWYDNEALEGDAVTAIPADATGDKTYWAKWTAKSYPSAPPTVSEETIDAIKAADSGETVTVDLSSGSTKLDKEVFETLAGRDVTLVVDLGDGVSWTVNGSDVPEDADFTDIDMGVTMNSDGIPVEVVNAITGERSSVQITLAHDGAFGFTMTLTAPLGAENAGYWANLYHFDEEADTMTFETAAPIGSDGSVSLSFNHASQYAIVIDDHNHGVVTLPFTDVSEGDWFYDPVCYVYSQGLMTGTSATTFEPNTSLSRAMLVAVLHRLEGSPAASAGDFTDVASGDWYAQAVNWAASVGVVNGFDDGTFQPNAAITREQMAAILRNYAEYKGIDVTASGDLANYSDAASVSDWAKESVAWAVDQGLISGMTVNTLQPQGLSTRAQVAAVLQRYLKN